MKNRKAQLGGFSIFTFIIVSFVAVLFFGGLIYTMGLLNDVFTEVGVKNEVNAGQPFYTNMSLASEQIWGQAYSSIQSLRLVAITYILSLAGSIIIVGFLEKRHPFLFFVYMLIGLLGLYFSPIISNSYETLLSSGVFGGQLSTFTASNFILLNLPTIVLIIFTLGGIGLFINLVRSDTNATL